MGEADNDERRTRREFDGHNFTAEGGKHIAGVFGTYDHAGNVSEWCRDVFASYKDPVDEISSERFARSGSPNVFVHRGGSWVSTEDQLRCGYRGDGRRRSQASDQIGFRVALEVPARPKGE